MNRRDFLISSTALAAVTPLAVSAAEKKKKKKAAAAPAPQPSAENSRRAHKKAFMYSTLRTQPANKYTIRQRFELWRQAGFAGVEVMSAMNQHDVLAARDATGLEIPSVIISTHWTHPLSSPNPGARATCLEGLKQGLRDAKAYGASSVLLVPAVVNKDIAYDDAYTRSMAEIKKAVPLAEELGVAIAIENVWNHFLLSPLEAVQYVDAFNSPMVRWHLDIGNLVNTAWPDQWVRILGPRIAKIHVKEYSRELRDQKGPRAGFQVDLLQGDSDWPAVMAALDAIGYSGWLISEQYRPPEMEDDLAWLKHLSGKMDQVIAS